MEVLKNSHSNKTSLILNINSKNKSSISNLKSSIKLNEIKNPHILDNMQNKIKDISSFYQRSHKPNPSTVNKPIEINKKDQLTNNYLIRTFSYKKAGKNLSKNKNSTKISINKKCKNNLFEYQAQKIIDDVNKDLAINNDFINSNYNSHKEINNIIKEKNLSNINNSEDININKNCNSNYDNNINNTCDNNSIIYKNMSYRNDTTIYNNTNNTNINNSTNNLHSIISLLNSKNKLYKRNHIQNLKNVSNLNKNWYQSNNHINNYESLITLNNSNISNNYLKNRAKINNLNISNHINSIIIKTNTNSNSKKNINNLNNMTIANYTNRNSNHKFLNYNNINSFNHNIKNNIFKNCKSQIFKKSITNDKENVNLNSNNYYINTSNSNKYMDKIKTNPSMKIVEDNSIKNIILDNKLNYKFMKRNKTDRGINNQKELTSKEKTNKNIYNHNNFQEIKSIYSKKQVSDFNNSKKKIIIEENNNSINNPSNKNKINYNNLNYNKAKNSIKKEIKISLLNNSNIFSPIIKVKNKGNHKHNGSIGTYTSRFNNLNIKNNNTISHIYLNSLDDSEKIISKKYSNIYNSNNSFPKKLGNKINYLNINLNNFGNMNETNVNTNTNSINNTISNNNAVSTLPTNVNTGSDNCLNFKKKLKNKFLRKQNTSYNNKSLISSNNNIIILNNISMNNLNNISFDYLSKIAKKHHLSNTYKTISSIRKQANNYVSKEKNIFDNPKEVERHREYYNNQKKLHKKKSNYKNNNRIKEQNLNYVNLKHMNNALKVSKKESINLAINGNYNIKKVQKNNNNIIHNHNSSNSGIYNHHSKKNASELNYIQNTSSNLNFGINHKNKIINNNNMSNINSTNQKTINHLIKSLKGKIIQSTREKILKINSAQISPKKNYNNQLNQLPKERKSKNMQNINMNKKKSLMNSIKVKEMKNNNSKKEIILRNDDENNDIKVKSVITEYDNKMKIMKKKINLNTLNDINEVSIDASKKIEESKNNEIDKENNISYINKTLDNNSKKEIKIIKKKYIRPKSQDINIKNDLIKDKNEEPKKSIEKEINIEKEEEKEEEKEKEKEEEKKEEEKEEPKTTLISSIIDLNTSSNNKDDDPQLGKEYLTDIIDSLLFEEDYFLNKKKYINPFYLENEKSELNPEMRTVAVDWLVLIHHKIFKFKENTLFLTIQIFDRYLSKTNLSIEKTELLLLTSFMLASKYNEIDYVNMQETLQLSQNKFTKEQIIEMETEILIKLDFEVLAPTMCEYFKLFASYLNLSEEKINHGFYVLNIVLVDFHMLEYPNFMLALAVVKLITKKVNKTLLNLIKNILKEHKVEKFLKMIDDEGNEEILEVCSKIKLLYNTFLETKYKNIQDKFSDNKYSGVSNYTNI